MARKLVCECGWCERCLKREYARERYRWPGQADEQRERVKRYQAENRDEILARRRANPWVEPDPAKTKARKQARQLNRFRQPCERCGSEESEKHHPDYEKPLEVIWLCRPCHGLEHRRVK